MKGMSPHQDNAAFRYLQYFDAQRLMGSRVDLACKALEFELLVGHSRFRHVAKVVASGNELQRSIIASKPVDVEENAQELRAWIVVGVRVTMPLKAAKIRFAI